MDPMMPPKLPPKMATLGPPKSSAVHFPSPLGSFKPESLPPCRRLSGDGSNLGEISLVLPWNPRKRRSVPSVAGLPGDAGKPVRGLGECRAAEA